MSTGSTETLENNCSKKEWFKLTKKLIKSAPNRETLRVVFRNIKEQEINLDKSESVLLKEMIASKSIKLIQR